MSATIAPVAGPASGLPQPIVPGAFYTMLFTLTGDSSYPTGGYPFGIAQIQAAIQQGMKIQYVLVASPVALVGDAVSTPATTGFVASYDYLNQSVQLFVTGAASGDVLAEYGSTDDASTAVVYLLVFFR